MILRDPKLYIDCTSTFRSDLNTGVQKVVRALINEISTFTSVTQLNCIPICYQFDGFYELNDALNISLETVGQFEKIDFRYDDIYFCPDAFWSYGMTDWYDHFRNQGVKIATLIYDLIPIYYPDYFSATAVNEFETALIDVIRKSDLLFAISESTKNDLKNYCTSKIEIFNPDKCKVIPLAPALQPCLEEDNPSRLPSDPYFLMVGTVEPRRGYVEAINEYKTYIAQGGHSSLLIIGKEGSSAIEVAKCIFQLKGKITWLTDASDAEVMAAYNRAQAVICPSHTEGYGMSVSEGLVYNGLVLANRLSVFGEFAGSAPYYFEIERKGDLARLLNSTPNLIRLTQNPNMGSWQETARIIASELIQISEVHGHHQAIEIRKNTAEAIRWAYWLLLDNAGTTDDIQKWLHEQDTVQGMFEGMKYELRRPDFPVNPESVRWLQLAINEQTGIGQEEIEYWRGRCSSIYDLRQTLLFEHCKLDTPISDFFVQSTLAIFKRNKNISEERIVFLRQTCNTNGDFLAALESIGSDN